MALPSPSRRSDRPRAGRVGGVDLVARRMAHREVRKREASFPICSKLTYRAIARTALGSFASERPDDDRSLPDSIPASGQTASLPTSLARRITSRFLPIRYRRTPLVPPRSRSSAPHVAMAPRLFFPSSPDPSRPTSSPDPSIESTRPLSSHLSLSILSPNWPRPPPPPSTFFPLTTWVRPDPATQLVGGAGSGLSPGAQSRVQSPREGAAGATHLARLRDSACLRGCLAGCLVRLQPRKTRAEAVSKALAKAPASTWTQVFRATSLCLLGRRKAAVLSHVHCFPAKRWVLLNRLPHRGRVRQ